MVKRFVAKRMRLATQVRTRLVRGARDFTRTVANQQLRVLSGPLAAGSAPCRDTRQVALIASAPKRPLTGALERSENGS